MKKTKYTGVYETDSGKYIYLTKIKNSNGEWKNVKSTVFEKAKDCYEALLQLKSSNSDDEAKITLGYVINGYLEAYSFSHRNSSLAHIKFALNHLYLLFDKEDSIKTIVSEKSILKFMTYVKNLNVTNVRKNRIITAYVNVCERAFYLSAITQQEYGFVKLNTTRFKGDKKNSNTFYTKDEFETFMSVIHNDFDRLLFNTLFYGGFRIGELLGIQVKDIKNGCININKQRLASGELFNETKNAKGTRCNPIKRDVYNSIENYIKNCNLQPNDFVFDTSRTTITRLNKKYGELAGLHHIRIHDFRHSFTCNIIQTYIDNNLTINFNQIADLLGDTAEMVLNVYSHAYAEEEIKIIDLL